MTRRIRLFSNSEEKITVGLKAVDVPVHVARTEYAKIFIRRSP